MGKATGKMFAKKPEPTKVEAKKVEPKKALVTAKKEEPKVHQEKTAIKVTIVAVPDACDAVVEGFKTKGKVGYFDAENKDCKECGEKFPKALAACKANTEAEVVLAAQKKADKKAPKKREGGGEKTPFGHYANTGAGKVDLLLLRKEGATLDEMKACRGAISSHLAALKVQGFFVTKKDGKYYGSLTKPAEAPVKAEAKKEKAPAKVAEPKKAEPKKKK